jgi:hypothetical protein
MDFGWILAEFGNLIKSTQNQKISQKCKLLTTSHRIYIIFYCFEVRNLDFWSTFWPNPERIFDGFLFVHLLGYSILTYHKSFTFSNQSSTTLLPFFQFSRPSSVERIISLKSCHSQANLSFRMSHFHSNSSAKKHNLRNKKPLLRNP